MIDSVATLVLLAVDAIIQFYYWLAIAHILLSWLTAFNIIDIHNRTAGKIVLTVNKLIMPIYDWIYQFLRPIGGGLIAMFDFRPMIFIVFLYFFQPMVHAMVEYLVNFLHNNLS